MKRAGRTAAVLGLGVLAMLLGWRLYLRWPPAPSAAAPRDGSSSAAARRSTRLPTVPLFEATLDRGDASAGELSGHVVSSTSDRGVPRATLTFFDHGGAGAAFSTVTDTSGAFRFVAPAPGPYELSSAVASGFLPFEPEVGHSPIAFEAKPGMRLTGVTLYLTPAVEYRGLVVDKQGKPIEGARVRSVEPERAEEWTSDAKGELTFTAPDFALLEARHPQHGVGLAILDLAAQTSRRLTLEITDALPPASAGIAGVVVDAQGAPVDGALVSGRCFEARLSVEAHTRSAPDGAFELRGLDDCAHRVTASARGTVTATVEGVKPGTRDVRLVLAAGGILRGRVRDAQGRAAAAFTVAVSEKLGGLERGEGTTRSFFDGEGRFEITGLKPGDYAVSAIANGKASSAEKSVSVPAPPAAVEVELTLRRGARVSGVVIDRATRKPLAGARVSVEGALDSEQTFAPVSSGTTTNADGRFELGGLSPGLHSIQIAAEGHHPRILSGLDVEPDGEIGSLSIDLAATADGEEPRLEYVGIGAVLKAEGDVLVIANVVAGGGAAEVGLVAGDQILWVDGIAASDLGFADAIQHIRGPEGTAVALVVRRKADGQVSPISVPRRALSSQGR
jgi:Carboxypeptidase regulatory-like domain/PDZ domain